MRIAMIAPLYESVPPRLYGGTERVVYYLSEGLVELGHEVSLFASGDSQSRARLFPISPEALRLAPACVDPLAWHILQLEKVYQQLHSFDLLHFHNDHIHFPLLRRCRKAHLTTLHGRLDIPDLYPLYKEFHEIPVVSISQAQREPLPHINWQGTVYHGLPRNEYPYWEAGGRGGYVAFLGRFSPEKGAEAAIEMARRNGIRIRLAAKIDQVNQAYYKERVKPLLRLPGVEYVGEISQHEKAEFLGQALGLLFPICWPEPFGLVMIEALAYGTPVLAFRQGSVGEILEDGQTGLVVAELEAGIRALPKLADLDRKNCRLAFEKRFTVDTMLANYLAIYKQLVREKESDD